MNIECEQVLGPVVVATGVDVGVVGAMLDMIFEDRGKIAEDIGRGACLCSIRRSEVYAITSSDDVSICLRRSVE